jgi:hypothetical protein
MVARNPSNWAPPPGDKKNQPFMVVLVHSNSERISKGLFLTNINKTN